MVRPHIDLSGVREFQRQLKTMDAELPKQIRVTLNAAGEVVLRYAKPKVPTRSGAAASSLKLRSSQREARLGAGGRKAPYYPWLDFGGKVGPADSVERPFITEGRYIYPTIRERSREIEDTMAEGLVSLAAQAGLVVT